MSLWHNKLTISARSLIFAKHLHDKIRTDAGEKVADVLRLRNIRRFA